MFLYTCTVAKHGLAFGYHVVRYLEELRFHHAATSSQEDIRLVYESFLGLDRLVPFP